LIQSFLSFFFISFGFLIVSMPLRLRFCLCLLILNHLPFFALAGLMNTKYPIIPTAANIKPKCNETPATLRKLKHL
jgi:hypothetical protein